VVGVPAWERLAEYLDGLPAETSGADG
jgi:hypothetical protein